VLPGGVLLTAIVRPSRVPEAAVAVPAALIVIVTGALPLHPAGETVRRLHPARPAHGAGWGALATVALWAALRI